jgi:hypothetical protein
MNLFWFKKLWAGHVAHMGERDACKVLVGKTEGKRLWGRLRRRWDNIKMDLQRIGWGAWSGVIWLQNVTISWLAEERLATQEGLCFTESSRNLKQYPGITWKKSRKAYISVYMIYPASYSMGTKSASARIKRLEGEADHSPTVSIEVSGAIPLRPL